MRISDWSSDVCSSDLNRVGEQGRGESSWLGWFLCATIDAFAPYAKARGEQDRAARWEQAAATVRKGLDDGGWDGQWYRRGYYDDGTPLGSHESDECRIDTIAQSWSVIAGGGDPAHAESAMEQVDRQRSEEHTSELQSLMRTSYAVFCVKKKKKQ